MLPNMDTFVDNLLLTTHSLDEYLRDNYSFLADYLPKSLVTFLSPYMNERMAMDEIRPQLPMILIKTFFGSLVFCFIIFYFIYWNYRCYSQKDDEDGESSTASDTDSSEDDIEVSVEMPQESTA